MGIVGEERTDSLVDLGLVLAAGESARCGGEGGGLVPLGAESSGKRP